MHVLHGRAGPIDWLLIGAACNSPKLVEDTRGHTYKQWDTQLQLRGSQCCLLLLIYSRKGAVHVDLRVVSAVYSCSFTPARVLFMVSPLWKIGSKDPPVYLGGSGKSAKSV